MTDDRNDLPSPETQEKIRQAYQEAEEGRTVDLGDFSQFLDPSDKDALERRALLRRIGALWRGDWTGHVFDGRDGNRWITTALDGDAAALEKLDTELKRLEEQR